MTEELKQCRAEFEAWYLETYPNIRLDWIASDEQYENIQQQYEFQAYQSAYSRRPAPAPGDHFAGGGKPISDGFALVPVRPTTAMLDVAISHALMVKLSSEYNWTQYMTDVWARMVGAAMAQGEKSQFERLEKAKQAIKDCE